MKVAKWRKKKEMMMVKKKKKKKRVEVLCGARISRLQVRAGPDGFIVVGRRRNQVRFFRCGRRAAEKRPREKERGVR